MSGSLYIVCFTTLHEKLLVIILVIRLYTLLRDQTHLRPRGHQVAVEVIL